MLQQSFNRFLLLSAASAFLGLTVSKSSVMAETPALTSQPDSELVPAGVSVEIFNTHSPGWRQLTGEDFERVNGDERTLVFEGSEALGSGTPLGVTRTKTQYRNFELVIEWMHLKPGGNSGVFAWVPPSALKDLPPDRLPNSGIEIQMLDHDFARQYTERTGRVADWFTSNGDVFAVGQSAMQPFEPKSPDGHRSFPSQQTTNGSGQWNQYYVRGINGEIRLWVNGTEVSGGRSCSPHEGYLCLESEGSPIRFRNIWVRELP